MKELIKKILREEVQKKFKKSNPNLERVIIKHMESLISDSKRVIPPPEDNYGNYSEEWCKGNNIVMEAKYFFNDEDSDEEKFFAGDLWIDEKEVEFLSKILQVRKAFILNIITEWYDDKYATKFGQETGHPEFEIDETLTFDNWRKCYQMIDVDNISREDMIDYLDKETLHRRNQLEELPDNELKSKYRSVYNSRLNNIGNRN
jgi:hypothetical protein